MSKNCASHIRLSHPDIFTLPDGSSEIKVTRKRNHDSEPANFETAVAATEFGKFNIFLFLISVPAGWSQVFETATMSYVFPAAQCDLDLSLNEKGLLNAITFLGMVSSGFVWGFLCDVLGRKRLMMMGYLGDACFVIISSLSQNFNVLLVCKFFGGVIINGPFSALTAYMSEFHSSQYRTHVQMIRGIVLSCGGMMLPLLAWAILPLNLDMEFYIFSNRIVLHSWNIYLLVCAFPSLISGIVFIFMPESPKFLMTVGRNEEALRVFKKVFRVNTGRSEDLFPIKALIDETKLDNNIKHGGHVTANRTKVQALREGFQQIKPLFYAPYLKWLILICFIQGMFMMSQNTIRLWLPQIFQAISDYQLGHNGTTASICTMMDQLQPNNIHGPCTVNLSESVYINTVIISVVSIIGYMIAGSLIDIVGRRLLIWSFSMLSGFCVLSIYFAVDSITTVVLATLFLTLAGICGNIVIAILIDLFPTTLRAMTLSLVSTFTRSASTTGNMVFPLLLQIDCAIPFFSIGCLLIGNSFLTLLLPKNDLKSLV